LDCVRLDDGSWLVSGEGQPHVVTGAARWCDCLDFATRAKPCKHIYRVMISQGDAGVWRALRALFALGPGWGPPGATP
jgi:hypothetical protein